MKLKAVTNRGDARNTPHQLVSALTDAMDELDVRIVRELLVQMLGFSFDELNGDGAAGFYVQESDFAQTGRETLFVEVRLTGASVTPDRAPNTFVQVLNKLVEIYSELIREHVDNGVHVSLMVSICLDQPVKPTDYSDPTQLLEHGPVQVYGEKKK